MRIILTIIGVLFFSIAFSQKIAISSIRTNLLYQDYENPIQVAVENESCNLLIVETNNGKITGDSCGFSIRPIKTGEAVIYIKKKINSDTILLGKQTFRVIRAPLPVPLIKGKSSGVVSKEFFNWEYGISAKYEFIYIDLNIKVKKYSVIIFRDSVPVYKEVVQGYLFTKAMQVEFQKLETRDEVIFYNIECLLPNDKIEKLIIHFMTFTIK